MSRLGVLVLTVVVGCCTIGVNGDTKQNANLQRLKRSPHYNDCYYPPPPPPPPPPYWPPPPPPPPPGPPPFWGPPHWRHHGSYSAAAAQAQSEGGQSQAGAIAGETQGHAAQLQQGQGESCDECGGHGDKAISNAQSGTGDAIAVAIARAKGNK